MMTTGGPTQQCSSGPRAWLAYAVIDSTGARSNVLSKDAIVLGAVSVSESLPATVEDRARLLNDVAGLATTSLVPKGRPSLFVFPAGYYGYDAGRRMFQFMKWPLERRAQTATLRAVMRFPVGSVVAVGFDSRMTAATDAPLLQQAWVGLRLAGGATIRSITRGEAALAERVIEVGNTRAAFFVCGEFTGSRTKANGPYCLNPAGRRQYLDDPVGTLSGCTILIDLAHRRVSAPVGTSVSPRLVHRRQMVNFSPHGTAVLAHHHTGATCGNRSHFKHRSNWVVFRGGRWLEEAAVMEIR